MTRRTQTILFHLLPAVFWLLAIGGIVIWEIFFNTAHSFFHYIPAVLALISVFIIYRIPRHTSAIEQCFQVAVLLGISSYWLPSVLFLLLPVWGYLIYQNLFNLRAFLATLIGLAFVAAWVTVLHLLHILQYPLEIAYNWYAWIPTGAVLLAFIATTIARQNLRVR